MKPTKKQIETLFTMAKERGLSPMWTHYYRNDRGQKTLAATTCVLLDVNNNCEPVSRGITIVSAEDNGEKSYGRYLSLRRAYQAARRLIIPNPDELKEKGLRTKGILNLSCEQHLPKAETLAGRGVPVEGKLTPLETDRIKIKQERKLAKTA